MLRYAEQRLIAWLTSKGGSDLASKVSSYVIEEGRVCAEILPYRIYVYDLGSFLGQFGYEALERRHDAPGDVFEHKKTELEGKTVGIFMYRVQGFPLARCYLPRAEAGATGKTTPGRDTQWP
jgi:hypothetical protein